MHSPGNAGSFGAAGTRLGGGGGETRLLPLVLIFVYRYKSRTSSLYMDIYTVHTFVHVQVLSAVALLAPYMYLEVPYAITGSRALCLVI